MKSATLKNEKLRILYRQPSVFTVVKSRKLLWAVYVARIEKKCTYIHQRNLLGKVYLEDNLKRYG
jgi:hypothetical protein